MSRRTSADPPPVPASDPPLPTRRWKLLIAYDGRPFSGWQSQPSQNTIQDLLEGAFAGILGSRSPRIHAAGRTDAGVHAEGQAAHIDLPAAASLDAAAWTRALNVRLPPAIRVLQVEPAAPGFHARFSALSKTYRYEIDTAPVLSPFRSGLAWFRPQPLDHDILDRLAQALLGPHDFAAFAAHRGPGTPPPRSTGRTVTQARLDQKPPGSLVLRFTADGFLYRMVRLLVGGMVRCASGRWPETAFLDLLHRPGAAGHCAFCAPPDGLYLESVHYGSETSPVRSQISI
ncbi:MAG TPA: tRNA pseudouridine(38-40) synthase TruA [Verrucomicrobiales bacterium]|nr:tRNA pseudouridine(38-40) synthase TruA [Verrucomicrobiales bacterium]